MIVKVCAAGIPLEIYSKTFSNLAPVIPKVRTPMAVRNVEKNALVMYVFNILMDTDPCFFFGFFETVKRW